MNTSDLNKNCYMLRGSLAAKGYMRWFHSFTGIQPQTGESRTFFIEIFLMNPAIGGDFPILWKKARHKKQGTKPSYCLVKAGVFPNEEGEDGRQLHAFYPMNEVRAAKAPLALQIGDCFCTENKLSGSIFVSPARSGYHYLMSNAGSMEWDLEIHKAIACNTGFWSGAFLRAVNGLDSFWHGEGIRSFFRGTVVLDDVLYQVSPDSSYGCADKHWGRCFPKPLFQLTCPKLFDKEHPAREQKESVLAISECCPRFFHFPLHRRLLIQLTLEGEDYSFGFSLPFLFPKRNYQKMEIKETEKRFIWHITAQNKTAMIQISGSCLKKEMLRFRYDSPDGCRPKQPLWAGSNAVGTIQLYRKNKKDYQPVCTLFWENGLCRCQRTKAF